MIAAKTKVNFDDLQIRMPGIMSRRPESVLTRTGNTDTGFVDRSWSLPVYWDAVGANKNDNRIFIM